MPSDNETTAVSKIEKFGSKETRSVTELAEAQSTEVARAKIESAFIMAMKRPRNEDQAIARLSDRCKNIRFAEAAIYKKPIGNSAIEGLSIRFAEDLIALWGNIHVSQQTTYDDPKRRKIMVSVIELEGNLCYDSEIAIEKTVERKVVGKDRKIIKERLNSSGQKIYVVNATEDEVNVKCAAEISKLIRNNGLRCIPGFVKEEAMDLLRKTLKGKIEKDPAGERRKLVEGFNELGIKPDRLAQLVGHPLEELTPIEIVELRMTWNALKSGETNWKELMDAKREQDLQPQKKIVARGTMKAGDSSKHQAVDDPMVAMNMKCEELKKLLTSDVYMRIMGDSGFENVKQMNLEQVKKFIATCEAKLKGN